MYFKFDASSWAVLSQAWQRETTSVLPFSWCWREATEEGKLNGESTMVGNLGFLHSACLTIVADTPVGTPGLALQNQVEVLRSRISGWVDSTTHLGVILQET